MSEEFERACETYRSRHVRTQNFLTQMREGMKMVLQMQRLCAEYLLTAIVAELNRRRSGSDPFELYVWENPLDAAGFPRWRLPPTGEDAEQWPHDRLPFPVAPILPIRMCAEIARSTTDARRVHFYVDAETRVLVVGPRGYLLHLPSDIDGCMKVMRFPELVTRKEEGNAEVPGD